LIKGIDSERGRSHTPTLKHTRERERGEREERRVCVCGEEEN
jgi:hypothetical protein